MNCIRYKSKNNEYHIILTFIKELKVFSCIEDRRKFKQIMVKVMKKMGCKILANAIMLNHVHMIIKEGKEKKISSIVISLCTRFAKYYNKHHNRSGKIFSRRYKSIPINDEIYFFRLFRYVSRNPVVAEQLDSPWEYEWSSAKDYMNKEGDFYFPEVVARYENSFKYHPYTLEEFVGFQGDYQLVYYVNSILNKENVLIPPFSLEEFVNCPIDDRMILSIDLKRYYDEEAKIIYTNELTESGIQDLKTHPNDEAKMRVIFRLRQIGLTLIQIRRYSSMNTREIRKIMYPA